MSDPTTLSNAAPAVVLDSNVVLDWLLFGDTGCQALGAAIERGHLRWIATGAMQAELEHVLGRMPFSARPDDVARVLAGWERWACTLPPSAPPGAAGRLHCTDPDDQKFIDFALSAGAGWLLSRDRALLKLARKARLRGLEVLTPRAWQALPPVR